MLVGEAAPAVAYHALLAARDASGGPECGAGVAPQVPRHVQSQGASEKQAQAWNGAAKFSMMNPDVVDEIMAHRGNNPATALASLTVAEKASKESLAKTLVPVPALVLPGATAATLATAAAAALACNLMTSVPLTTAEGDAAPPLHRSAGGGGDGGGISGGGRIGTSTAALIARSHGGVGF